MRNVQLQSEHLVVGLLITSLPSFPPAQVAVIPPKPTCSELLCQLVHCVLTLTSSDGVTTYGGLKMRRSTFP